MRRIIVFFLPLLLCAITLSAGGAGAPIAGKWSCVSTDERGTEVAWTLLVRDDTGKMAGSITLTQSGDQIDILEPALHDNTFTFKIRINPEEIAGLTVRIEDSKLSGTFKGKSSGEGTIKCTRLR